MCLYDGLLLCINKKKLHYTTFQFIVSYIFILLFHVIEESVVYNIREIKIFKINISIIKIFMLNDVENNIHYSR
jgi:hypothetical protein